MNTLRHLETEAKAARRRLTRLQAQLASVQGEAPIRLVRAVDDAERQCERAYGRWDRAFSREAA